MLDLTGRSSGPAVEVACAPALDLVLSLCAYTLPGGAGTLDDGTAWFHHVRRAASPTLLDGIDALGSGIGKAWVNLLGLALEPPAVPEPGELVARVAALSPLEVKLHLLGEHVPAYRASISGATLRRAARGDPGAAARLLADAAYFSGEADPVLRPLLALPASRVKRLVVDVLRGWDDEVYSPVREGRLRRLGVEAARARAIVAVRDPAGAVEVLSGVELVPTSEIRRIVLVPQLAVRPWLFLCEYDESRLLCYPAPEPDDPANDGAPPARLVLLTKALGDERRLRMLRSIAERSATFAELTARFGLPKTTVYHHLAILRAAGLLTVSSDVSRRYRVRADALPEVSALLEWFLRVPDPEGGGTT